MKMHMLLGAVVLVAVGVIAVSATRPPTYEASALLMVGQKELSDGKIPLIPLAPSPETLQQLTHTMVVAIESRPVAEEAIQRLGLELSPDQLLNNLTVEQVETSQFIQLTYTDSDPGRAEEVVNTVGQVSSERISNTSAAANDLKATVYERAITPASPVSPKPLRNGLLTLVVGLVLCAGTRPCPAGRRHKGRRHTRRTALPPRGRPSGGARQAAQGLQHSRAHKGEEAASGARAPREADGGGGGA